MRDFIDNREKRQWCQQNEQFNLSVKKLQKIRKAKQAVNNLNVFLSIDKQDKTKFDWVV